MKLVTYHKADELRSGLISGEHVVDIARAARALGTGPLPTSLRAILELGAPAYASLRKLDRAVATRLRAIAKERGRRPAWARVLGDVHLAPPIPNPGKVICIGQNYLDHCREQNVQPPKTPIIFSKFPTTLTGPFDPVRLPPPAVAQLIDYEAELAFVIGTPAKAVTRENAMRHVAGYMVMNDVTGRDAQRADGQWVRGKSFDTFGPCGPWLVTPDEIPDHKALKIGLRLNGETMQDSSTSNLIFDIPFILEYLSRGMTFMPGDIISTGTPPGVGIFRTPPVILKPGDEIETWVQKIGVIRNRVEAGS